LLKKISNNKTEKKRGGMKKKMGSIEKEN